MFQPKQVVNLDIDPLADRDNRTGIVVAESEYNDWSGTARYNLVCITTDFDEYSDHEHTKEIHKDQHMAVGNLRDHSLVCPWATLALPGSSITHITTDDGTRQKLELTDIGHELVSQTVYKFFNSHNNY